jgi:cation transport ATPase
VRVKVIYRIDGLECADCAARMERVLGKMDGVKNARVNFLTRKVTMDIEGDEETVRSEAEARIRKIESHVKLARI